MLNYTSQYKPVISCEAEPERIQLRYLAEEIAVQEFGVDIGRRLAYAPDIFQLLDSYFNQLDLNFPPVVDGQERSFESRPDVFDLMTAALEEGMNYIISGQHIDK